MPGWKFCILNMYSMFCCWFIFRISLGDISNEVFLSVTKDHVKIYASETTSQMRFSYMLQKTMLKL
jgi:hypothetical protein